MSSTYCMENAQWLLMSRKNCRDPPSSNTKREEIKTKSLFLSTDSHSTMV